MFFARCSRLPLVVSSTGAGGWVERATRLRGRRRSAGGRLTVPVAIGSIIRSYEQSWRAGSRVVAVSRRDRSEAPSGRSEQGRTPYRAFLVTNRHVAADPVTHVRFNARPPWPGLVVRGRSRELGLGFAAFRKKMGERDGLCHDTRTDCEGAMKTRGHLAQGRPPRQGPRPSVPCVETGRARASTPSRQRGSRTSWKEQQ